MIEEHEFHVVEYSHPRLAFAITSPRSALAGENVHRRRPGAESLGAYLLNLTTSRLSTTIKPEAWSYDSKTEVRLTKSI